MTSSVLLLGAAEQCLSFKERSMHGTASVGWMGNRHWLCGYPYWHGAVPGNRGSLYLIRKKEEQVAELMKRVQKVCRVFGYSYPNVAGALSTEDTSSLTLDEKKLYNNFIERYRAHKARFNVYVS